MRAGPLRLLLLSLPLKRLDYDRRSRSTRYLVVEAAEGEEWLETVELLTVPTVAAGVQMVVQKALVMEEEEAVAAREGLDSMMLVEVVELKVAQEIEMLVVGRVAAEEQLLMEQTIPILVKVEAVEVEDQALIRDHLSSISVLLGEVEVVLAACLLLNSPSMKASRPV